MIATSFYITNITKKETILKKMFIILCEMNIEYNTTICHKTRTDPYLLTSQTFMTWWVLLWCVALLWEGKVIFSGWELTEPSLLGVPSQTCAFFSVTFWKSKLRSWRIYCNFSQSIYLKFVTTITTADCVKKVSQVYFFQLERENFFKLCVISYTECKNCRKTAFVANLRTFKCKIFWPQITVVLKKLTNIKYAEA